MFCRSKKKLQLQKKVVVQPKSFLSGNALVNEEYVLVYSKKLAEIFSDESSKNDQKGNKQDEKDQIFMEGLVKITPLGSSQKPIFRKCRAHNEVKSDEIALGYRTNKALFQNDYKEPGRQVIVERACWFCYLWHNMKSDVKHAFRSATIGLIITALGSIASIASIIITLLNSK